MKNAQPASTGMGTVGLFVFKKRKKSAFHSNCAGGSTGYNNSGSGPAEVREQWTSQLRSQGLEGGGCPDGGAVQVKRESPCTEFSSVQDGIYMLRKVHMHSIPSLRSFPCIVSETIPMVVWLIMVLSHLFKACQALPLSTPFSSRWSKLWCTRLCAGVVNTSKKNCIYIPNAVLKKECTQQNMTLHTKIKT